MAFQQADRRAPARSLTAIMPTTLSPGQREMREMRPEVKVVLKLGLAVELVVALVVHQSVAQEAPSLTRLREPNLVSINGSSR